MSLLPICPSCSSLLHFTNDNTNLIVCRCGAVVFRNALDIRIIKDKKVISSADTILQPGTEGTWSGKKFSLLGRCRLWIDDLTLNVWTMAYHDGTIGLLTEGYGEYLVLDQQEATAPALPDGLRIGQLRNLMNGASFWLNKRSVVNSWDFEGEIIMPAVVDHPVIYEFGSSDSRVYWRWNIGTSTPTYKGVIADFAELFFTNLREKDLISRSINCPNCKTAINLKNYPQSRSCVCPSCEQWIAFHENRSPIKTQPGKTTHSVAPLLYPGTKGKLKGIEYEVMGYAVKCQTDYAAYWIEYTLFNPAVGYAFLSEYNGHWIYLRERSDALFVKTTDNSLEWRKEPFRLFNAYYALIVKAGGEFPGNIFDKQDTHIREFISPPEMWIREQEPQKPITWFFATDLSVTELKEGWPDIPMPAQKGMGTLQEKEYIAPGKLIGFSLFLLLLLGVVHLAINQTKSRRVLLSQTVTFDSTNKKATINIPTFYLDKWRSNIELDFSAGINNSWLELSGTLTNTDNGKEYSFEEGIEYYYGVSEGESWTEGERRKKVDLMAVPGGNYTMEIEGTREYGSIDSFDITVTYDTPLNSNYWSLAGVFVVIPVIMGIRIFLIEKKRWMDSPFNPYSSE